MADPNEDSDPPIDIPIWVNDTQRWVTGLTKRTTCDDVIYALLFHDKDQGGEATENFAIFERWREVERPLQARTKILKIWSAWGSEQCNVQLDMRKLDDYFLPGEHSRSKRKHRRSRHRSRHNSHCRRCENGDCYNTGQMKCLEGIVKLVITQERKLQDLKERIEDTDGLIVKFENKRHMSRMDENGHNYVQKAYLDSASEDSSVDGFLVDIDEGCVDEYISFCEHILDLEHKINLEKTKIQRLSSIVEAGSNIQKGFPKFKTSVSSVVDSSVQQEGHEQCEELQVRINRLVTTNMMQRYKVEEIKLDLQSCDQQIVLKQQILKSLKFELENLETSVPEENHFTAYSQSDPHCDNDTAYSQSDPHCDNDIIDNVDRLRVLDNYPKSRTKSVTFDDRLNHMHVIGSSRESLLQDVNQHSTSQSTHIPKADFVSVVDADRYRTSENGESKVTSILKNRDLFKPNHYGNDQPYFNGDSSCRYQNINRKHYEHGGRNYLPSTMYTYANDGHYTLIGKPCVTNHDDDSDTGLSSMHSDESPGLETLV